MYSELNRDEPKGVGAGRKGKFVAVLIGVILVVSAVVAIASPKRNNVVHHPSTKKNFVGDTKTLLSSPVARADLIDGSEVRDNKEYPFVAAVQLSPHRFCTGAILTPWYVLCAAHCFESFRQRHWVIVGSAKYDPSAMTTMTTAQKIPGTWILLDPTIPAMTASQIAKTGNGKDIALIRLDYPIEIASNAKPIQLEKVEPNIGTKLLQMGFGYTGNNKPPAPFLKAGIATVTKCPSWFNNPNRICVSNGPRVDHGDSGGPLVQHVKGEFSVLGDCSLSSPTSIGAQNQFDVYVSVPKRLNWIRKEMNKVMSGPLDEYQVWIRSGLSNNGGRFILSASAVGVTLHLARFDSDLGRQRFVFESAPGGTNNFFIKNIGGTAYIGYLSCSSSSSSVSFVRVSSKTAWTVTINQYDSANVADYLIQCTANNEYLSASADGKLITTSTDDKSGRQYWSLTRFDWQARGVVTPLQSYPLRYYNIKTAVSSTELTCLSASKDGNGANMWYTDDGSGKQEIQFDYRYIGGNDFGIVLKSGQTKKYLTARQDGLIFLSFVPPDNYHNGQSLWGVVPQPGTNQVLIKHTGTGKYLRMADASTGSLDLADAASVTVKDGNTNWLISLKIDFSPRLLGTWQVDSPGTYCVFARQNAYGGVTFSMSSQIIANGWTTSAAGHVSGNESFAYFVHSPHSFNGGVTLFLNMDSISADYQTIQWSNGVVWKRISTGYAQTSCSSGAVLKSDLSEQKVSSDAAGFLAGLWEIQGSAYCFRVRQNADGGFLIGPGSQAIRDGLFVSAAGWWNKNPSQPYGYTEFVKKQGNGYVKVTRTIQKADGNTIVWDKGDAWTRSSDKLVCDGAI